MTTRFMDLGFGAIVLTATLLTQGCASADPGTDERLESVDGVEQGMGPIHLLCQTYCKATTACSASCIGAGTCAAYGQCAGADPDGDGVLSGSDNCATIYNPNQANCDGDALGDACETDPGRYVFKARTYAICHIDPDLHIDGADVELYTVDAFQDTSCLHLPDGYRKRRLASVHCGFHSSGTCENRVTARIEALAAEGYFPTTASDRDECPHPRISDAALAPLTPTPRPPRPTGPIP